MASPKTFFLRLYEIEHFGDLDNCIQDLVSSGAQILDHRLDPDAEEAVVKITVQEFATFKQAFQKTDSADFCDSLDWFDEKEMLDA